MKRDKTIVAFATNLCLLSASSVMVLSGLVIQIHYHMKHLEKNRLILGIDYFEWSDIHKMAIVMVSLFAINHIILHWKWYKAVVQKKERLKTSSRGPVDGGLSYCRHYRIFTMADRYGRWFVYNP